MKRINNFLIFFSFSFFGIFACNNLSAIKPGRPIYALKNKTYSPDNKFVAILDKKNVLSVINMENQNVILANNSVITHDFGFSLDSRYLFVDFWCGIKRMYADSFLVYDLYTGERVLAVGQSILHGYYTFEESDTDSFITDSFIVKHINRYTNEIENVDEFHNVQNIKFSCKNLIVVKFKNSIINGYKDSIIIHVYGYKENSRELLFEFKSSLYFTGRILK